MHRTDLNRPSCSDSRPRAIKAALKGEAEAHKRERAAFSALMASSHESVEGAHVLAVYLSRVHSHVGSGGQEFQDAAAESRAGIAQLLEPLAA